MIHIKTNRPGNGLWKTIVVRPQLLLSRDGTDTKRRATDLGWKDTALVSPGESGEIVPRVFSVTGNCV